MNALGKLFLKGLAVVIPIVLTLAILWWMAAGAEQLMGAILKFTLPTGWYVPGMGLVSGLVLIALIGLLSHVLIFQKLFNLGEAIFHRLPLVKTIYTAIKDFIAYLSPEKANEMGKVVLVQLPDQSFQLIGFVTREHFSDLSFTPAADDPVLWDGRRALAGRRDARSTGLADGHGPFPVGIKRQQAHLIERIQEILGCRS